MRPQHVVYDVIYTYVKQQQQKGRGNSLWAPIILELCGQWESRRGHQTAWYGRCRIYTICIYIQRAVRPQVRAWRPVLASTSLCVIIKSWNTTRAHQPRLYNIPRLCSGASSAGRCHTNHTQWGCSVCRFKCQQLYPAKSPPIIRVHTALVCIIMGVAH